jgi:NADH:ubiquinone oxidoreductase subunit F (NADH-binding)
VHLREWARRHAAGKKPGNAVADLLGGTSDVAVAAERGLPLATVAGIRSFYDQLEHARQVCDGTACHFAGGPVLAARMAERGPLSGVRCLGHCYDAPAARVRDAVCAARDRAALQAWIAGPAAGAAAPIVPTNVIPRRSLVEPPVVLRNLIGGVCGEMAADYALPDGDTILAAVEATGLRGRGGAAFPTGAKWRAARETFAAERYVVANGDEGDPGSFGDRLLLEEDPHAVLAGMVACARAIGARRGIVYIRAEYPRAQAVLHAAVEAARAAGFLGDPFDVQVICGAGSYVCGEETALLSSIEGRRGEPRPKPPYPSEAGLFGMPTVVQNVETLAVVPWIVRQGRGSGTKAVSLAGAVAEPGVVEVALGTPLRRILEEGGGGPAPGRRWKMALVGGPMGRVLPERMFDTPLSYDALPGMGHAGVVVLDDTVTPRALAEHLFQFARSESCGTCTPCRVGTSKLAVLRDRAGMERLLETLELGSLCGFGQGVPRPIRDLLLHFGDEVFA